MNVEFTTPPLTTGSNVGVTSLVDVQGQFENWIVCSLVGVGWAGATLFYTEVASHCLRRCKPKKPANAVQKRKVDLLRATILPIVTGFLVMELTCAIFVGITLLGASSRTFDKNNDTVHDSILQVMTSMTTGCALGSALWYLFKRKDRAYKNAIKKKSREKLI